MPRTRTVRARVTPDEYNTIAAAAASQHREVADYVRLVLLGHYAPAERPGRKPAEGGGE